VFLQICFTTSFDFFSDPVVYDPLEKSGSGTRQDAERILWGALTEKALVAEDTWALGVEIIWWEEARLDVEAGN
jgi:hypothetical protein